MTGHPGQLNETLSKRKKKEAGRKKEGREGGGRERPTSYTEMEMNKSDDLNILSSKACQVGPLPLLAGQSLCRFHL